MLMVAPMGSTNCATRLSTWHFSTTQRIVAGSAAEDDDVPNAVSKASEVLRMYLRIDMGEKRENCFHKMPSAVNTSMNKYFFYKTYARRISRQNIRI